jgi:hypothetical protein
MSSPSIAWTQASPRPRRIKALELIGKMTEVALFTERREIVQVTDAAQIRERLMDTLRTITQAQVTDVTDTAADSLLAELAGPSEPEPVEAGQDEPEPVDELEPGAMAIEPEQAQPADI